jgi:hypothetical protein
MKLALRYKNKIQLFSNENIKVDDLVYPLVWSHVVGNDVYVTSILSLEAEDAGMTGWPDNPHKIINLNHTDYMPYKIHTDHGGGPEGHYFKHMGELQWY